MSFHVGQPVLCVNDKVQACRPVDTGPGSYYCPNWPKEGTRYTIREIRKDLSGRDRLLLFEIVNPLRDWLDCKSKEADWSPNRFRPLDTRDLPVKITALLDIKNHTPLPEHKPRRQKVSHDLCGNE